MNLEFHPNYPTENRTDIGMSSFYSLVNEKDIRPEIIERFRQDSLSDKANGNFLHSTSAFNEESRVLANEFANNVLSNPNNLVTDEEINAYACYGRSDRNALVSSAKIGRFPNKATFEAFNYKDAEGTKKLQKRLLEVLPYIADEEMASETYEQLQISANSDAISELAKNPNLGEEKKENLRKKLEDALAALED